MVFAALQLRVNAAVAAKLLTDAATLNGSAITGKFSNGSSAVLGMLGGFNPQFTLLETDLPVSDPRSLPLVFNSINFIVRENKPDGNGMTILELDKQ